MMTKRYLLLLLAVLFTKLSAQGVEPTSELIPSADEALRAYEHFAADPINRLDKTEPFLAFIRGSGQIHIVINETLLAWMYDDFPEHHKAVLYAAFLGGNMSSQLANTDLSANRDNVGGMRGALQAYAAIQATDPDFRLALFEQLKAAEKEGRLAAVVEQILAAADTD